LIRGREGKKYILQKMIAVEACGISNNALLMAMPSPQHLQAAARLLFFMMLPQWLIFLLRSFALKPH